MEKDLTEKLKKFFFPKYRYKVEEELSKKKEGGLKSLLLSKWDGNPEIFMDYNEFGAYDCSSEIILHADAILQLKEKGYEAVVGIKTAGISYAKMFEMMGYSYSEIDYSFHKRKMEKPIMEEEEILKLTNKKVILAEIDFITGITLERVIKFLRDRKINVTGAYMGNDSWFGRPYKNEIEWIEESKLYWKSGKKGLRKLNNKFLYENERIPNDFEIYTFPERWKMKNSIEKVSNYLDSFK